MDLGCRQQSELMIARCPFRRTGSRAGVTPVGVTGPSASTTGATALTSGEQCTARASRDAGRPPNSAGFSPPALSHSCSRPHGSGRVQWRRRTRQACRRRVTAFAYERTRQLGGWSRYLSLGDMSILTIRPRARPGSLAESAPERSHRNR